MDAFLRFSDGLDWCCTNLASFFIEFDDQVSHDIDAACVAGVIPEPYRLDKGPWKVQRRVTVMEHL